MRARPSGIRAAQKRTDGQQTARSGRRRTGRFFIGLSCRRIGWPKGRAARVPKSAGRSPESGSAAHSAAEREVAMLTAALLMLANTMLFSLRLNGGGSFPKPLTAEEEREYLARMEQGDRAARDALIERNLRLVAHVVKKYYCTQSNQEDLLSIGTIGLIKGISTFQPSKGARLATYAARCIENEILMYFRSQKKLQGEVSLADSIDTDKEGNALQLMDVVGVDDTMLDDIHDRDSAMRLRRLVAETLTAREAEIIRLRYGLGGTVPLTQKEVASSFGISRSYVSRRN